MQATRWYTVRRRRCENVRPTSTTLLHDTLAHSLARSPLRSSTASTCQTDRATSSCLPLNSTSAHASSSFTNPVYVFVFFFPLSDNAQRARACKPLQHTAQQKNSLGVREPEVVPARPGPLRHRVRLAREPPPVALEVPPVDGPRQAARRVVPGLEALHLRQRQRELGNVLPAAEGEANRGSTTGRGGRGGGGETGTPHQNLPTETERRRCLYMVQHRNCTEDSTNEPQETRRRLGTRQRGAHFHPPRLFAASVHYCAETLRCLRARKQNSRSVRYT